MLSFRNLSLRRKQTLIIMVTSTVVLLMACAAFVAFDVLRFRREMVASASSLAEVVGNNMTAALDFNDPATAVQTLAALRGEPNIVLAHVHTRDGQVFAAYVREGALPPPEIHHSVEARHEFTANHLHLFRPIMQSGEQVGTIELVATLDGLYVRLWRYAGIAGLVLTVSLLAAFGLSSRLQKLVSDPILHLALMARSVALEKNYSVRATKQGEDELGQLVDGFNEMLAQIQERDANLERRVEERTNELARSQGLYHSLVEQLPTGVFRKDAEGRYVFANSWFLRLKGMTADQVIGKTPHELSSVFERVPGSASAGEWEARLALQGADHHELIMRTGTSIDIEEEYPAADGKVRHLQVLKTPVFGPGGKILGSQGILFDISERKRAEEKLRRTEELYRSAIGGAGAVPYSFDFNTRSYVFMGEGIQQLISYAPHEISGDLWKRIIQKSVMLGEAAGLDKDEAARRVKAGELRHWHCDMCVTTRDGETRWIADTSVQSLDESGQPIGAMGILQDITERKRAEAELEQTHRQLLEISRAAGMAEIATNVLHNIGNVLNSVNVSANLVADSLKKSKTSSLAKVVTLLREHAPDLGTFFTSDPRGRQLPAYLSQLSERLLADQKASVKELDSLRGNIEHINEIVAVQQSYAKVSGLKEIINLNDLVEDGLRMNEGALHRHGVEIIREFEDLPPMNVEKHKILQILVNLVRNAKHACQDSDRKDRQLTMRVVNGDGRIKISVIDNGVGIPPENLTRIFNHGFTTRKDGHGFGLHSGALAAREMGGSLTVQSGGPGQGATFTLELPQIPPTSDTVRSRRTKLELLQ